VCLCLPTLRRVPNRFAPPKLEGRTDKSFWGVCSPRKSVAGPLGDGQVPSPTATGRQLTLCRPLPPTRMPRDTVFVNSTWTSLCCVQAWSRQTTLSHGAFVPIRHACAAIPNAADRETGHVALGIGVRRGDGIGRRGRPGSQQLSGWNNHYRPVKHVGLFADAGQHVRPIATRAPNEPLDPHGITSIRLTTAVISPPAGQARPLL